MLPLQIPTAVYGPQLPQKALPLRKGDVQETEADRVNRYRPIRQSVVERAWVGAQVDRKLHQPAKWRKRLRRSRSGSAAEALLFGRNLCKDGALRLWITFLDLLQGRAGRFRIVEGC